MPAPEVHRVVVDGREATVVYMRSVSDQSVVEPKDAGYVVVTYDDGNVRRLMREVA